MNNSIDFVNKDINLLRLELREVTKRLIVTEVQVNVLVEDYKFKKQIWARLREQLAVFGWIFAGLLLILFMIKLHG